MRHLDITLKRFSIKIGDLEPIDADAYLPLRDELTKELVGISWFIAYEDHNEIGTAKDIPYIIIDRKYPYQLQDFLNLAQMTIDKTNSNPKGYG